MTAILAEMATLFSSRACQAPAMNSYVSGPAFDPPYRPGFSCTITKMRAAPEARLHGGGVKHLAGVVQQAAHAAMCGTVAAVGCV